MSWQGQRPSQIAFLGQRSEFDSRFPVRLRDLVEMGTWRSLGFTGQIDSGGRTAIDMAMDRTGSRTPRHATAYAVCGSTSARAVRPCHCPDASVILLDEPFTAIDQSTEADLLSLIDEWSVEGRAVIMVLHDLSAVLHHCHSSLLLGRGKSLFGTPSATLTGQSRQFWVSHPEPGFVAGKMFKTETTSSEGMSDV